MKLRIDWEPGDRPSPWRWVAAIVLVVVVLAITLVRLISDIIDLYVLTGS